ALTLKTLADGREQALALPEGGGFHTLRWSPSGRWLLLQRRTAAGTELWVSEVARPALRRLSGLCLNTVLERDFAWLGPDELLVTTVPETLGAPPAPALPLGPTVQESFGRKSPERTRQNLLTNAQDEALFTHLATSQLRRVNLASGAHSPIGSPGLLSRVETVGGGAALLVERLATPFSYQVEWDDFARLVQLLDASSGRVLRDLPGVRLKEGVPVQGVVTGARQFWSSPHGDGAVFWVEALDGGDPRTRVPHRDRVLRLDPPYRGEPREVHRSVHRLVAWNWLDARERALVSEFDRDRVWVTSEIVALDGSAAPLRLQDRSRRDRYADPGTPLRRLLPASGRSVVRVDEGALWLAGAGAS
ncbi:MAG: hypothetical protein ACKOD9_04035, partial [Rubrivivax sp.]